MQMAQKPRIYFTDTHKALMWERWRQGESLQKIAQLFGRNHSSISRILAETGGIRPARRCRSRLALTLAEDTLVLGNGARYVTVKDFNTTEGTATVAIGFGRGKRQICFRDLITKQFQERAVHVPIPVGNDTGSPRMEPPRAH
jgi:hypothetical protein